VEGARGTAEADNYEFPVPCVRAISSRPEGWGFSRGFPESAVEFDGGRRRQQDPQRQAGANPSCPAALEFRFLVLPQIESRSLDLDRRYWDGSSFTRVGGWLVTVVYLLFPPRVG
jgi:hypothetical protein